MINGSEVETWPDAEVGLYCGFRHPATAAVYLPFPILADAETVAKELGGTVEEFDATLVYVVVSLSCDP